MPEAKLSVNIPDEIWVRDISTKYPDTVFSVISALPGDEYGVGVVEVEGEDYDDALNEIPEHETIEEMEILWRDDESEKALIQIRTTKPAILEMASQSGVPIEMPFEIRDGVGEWELKTSRESLSQLSSIFDSMGVKYTIEYIRDVESGENFLTDKQREIVEAARKLGYYDTPRETSLSEIADEFGIAKSTCSEILHRAEGKIMKEFLDS